jgi:hypothetical protein
MNLSEFDDSIFDSTDAFALQPSNPKSLYVMGKSYEMKGDLRNALNTFKKMLVVDPNSGEGKAGVSRLKAKVESEGIIDAELHTDLPPVPKSRRRTSLKFGSGSIHVYDSTPTSTPVKARTNSAEKCTPPTRSRTNSVSDEIPTPRDGFPPMHPAVAFALEASNRPHESSDSVVSRMSSDDGLEVVGDGFERENAGASVASSSSAPPASKQLRDVISLLHQHKHKKGADTGVPQKVYAVPSTWWGDWVAYASSSLDTHLTSATSDSDQSVGSPRRTSSRDKTTPQPIDTIPLHLPPGAIPVGTIASTSKKTHAAAGTMKPNLTGFDAQSVLVCSSEDPNVSCATSGAKKLLSAPHSYTTTDEGLRSRGFVTVPEEVWRALHSWYGADSSLQLCARYKEGNEDNDEFDPSFLSSEMFRAWTKEDDDKVAMTTSGNISSGPTASQSVGSSSGRKGVMTSSFCAVCLDEGAQRCSRCKAVYYCCAKCQTCDWPFHKTRCQMAPKSHADSSKSKRYNDRSGVFGTLGLRSRASVHASLLRATSRLTCRGMMGLANLGNSCYFNASLQCLSHTFPLTKYLISCQYEPHVNLTSRDGTGGQLVKEYAALLREMWLKSFPSEEIRPIALRRLIGRVNEEYATLQQQDAHDVLVFLLDTLHEDVNLVAKKPYVENSEGNGENDDEISKESWEKHRLRHNSVVQDIVGAQLRSQVGNTTNFIVLTS